MDVLDIEGKILFLHQKAKILIKNKRTDDAIIQELVEEGIEKHYAVTIIENVRQDLHNKKQYWKHIIMGSFITVAGLLINYLSYNFAEETGNGQFLLLWGVVVAGIVTIARAFILFRK